MKKTAPAKNKKRRNTQYPIRNTKPLLEVEGLTVRFSTTSGTLTAVDDISYSIRSGEFVAVLGESGCGKSVSALSLLRLVPSPGRIDVRRLCFGGKELLELSEDEIRRVRGKEIAMIFQEPMTSLNPLFRVGDQIGEAIKMHHRLDRGQLYTRVVESLNGMGLTDPERVADSYPHELSGGMRQRAMIAMALSCCPKLLIADEPTTALDVTIQAQILELLTGLQKNKNLAVLFITHDVGVVYETAERVMVMYTGRVVEDASVRQLFDKPLHPYTIGLLASVPDIRKAGRELPTIKGQVSNMLRLPSGCHFRDRCPRAIKRCAAERPELRSVGAGRRVACIRV